MGKISRAFTLLEITIALVILGLIGAIMSKQMYGAISSFRFQKEVTDLYQALKTAQMIAITYETDLTLSFKQKKGKWIYQLQMDEPLKGIDRKEHVLKQVKKLSLDDKVRQKPFELTINPSGRIDPQIKLTFIDDEDKRTIDMKIPIQIVLKQEKK